MLPNRLSNGMSFKISDTEGKDITHKTDLKSLEGVKIDVDIDKDGKFGGEKDISITSKDEIKLLLDSVKGNSKSITSIPFADEIEGHIISNREAGKQLNIAYQKGMEAAKIPFINVFKIAKKQKLGEESMEALQKGFGADRSNPISRACFGLALLELKNHFFSKMIQNVLLEKNLLDKSFDNEISKVKNLIKEDKFDVLGRLTLKNILENTNAPQSEIDSIKNELSSLKKSHPEIYSQAEIVYKELTAGTKSIGEVDNKTNK